MWIRKRKYILLKQKYEELERKYKAEKIQSSNLFEIGKSAASIIKKLTKEKRLLQKIIKSIKPSSN